MFYSQVVPNCWIYWGSSLFEREKCLFNGLWKWGDTFTQLNPPLLPVLTTLRIKVCLSFVSWLGYHQKSIYPSLGKQRRGYSTVQFQSDSLPLPLTYLLCIFFTFLYLKDFFCRILHFLGFVLRLHSHRDLVKNQKMATLATMLSSCQIAALINQYFKSRV